MGLAGYVHERPILRAKQPERVCRAATTPNGGSVHRLLRHCAGGHGQLPRPMRHVPGWAPIAAAIGHPSLDSSRATGTLGCRRRSRLLSSAAYRTGSVGNHSQRRILVWKHRAVTSEQRIASRDELRTPGEKMMAAILDERSVPYRYESFGEGANPDFRANHPVAGEVMLEVYEPVYLLPRNPDGSYRSGSCCPAGTRGPAGTYLSPEITAGCSRTRPGYPVRAGHRQHERGTGNRRARHSRCAVRIAGVPVERRRRRGPRRAGTAVFGSGGRLQAHLNTRFSAVAPITRGAADTSASRPGMSAPDISQSLCRHPAEARIRESLRRPVGCGRFRPEVPADRPDPSSREATDMLAVLSCMTHLTARPDVVKPP